MDGVEDGGGNDMAVGAGDGTGECRVSMGLVRPGGRPRTIAVSVARAAQAAAVSEVDASVEVKWTAGERVSIGGRLDVAPAARARKVTARR
jgi:hypothetical protein